MPQSPQLPHPPGGHPSSPAFLKDAASKVPLLSILWENSPVGIIIIVPGPDDKQPVLIGDCNPAICETHGYTRDELVGQSMDILHEIPWTPTVDRTWFSSPQQGESIQGMSLHRRKDASTVMIEYNLVFTEIGEVRCAIGFDSEVNDRSEEQNQLHGNANRWMNAMESSEEGVWEIDLAKQDIWTSPRWQWLLGKPQREETQSLANLYRDLHPEDQTQLRTAIEAIQTDQAKNLNFEGRIRNTAGQWVWFNLRGKAVFSPQGTPERIIGNISNITERIEAEKALKEARTRAEDANQSKSQFLAAMSHEIRTPMNGVLGMAALLADTELDENQKATLRTITESGDSLLTIIDEILSFSKLEAGGVELEKLPFDLHQALHQALEVIRPLAAAKNLELHYSVHPDAPSEVIGDKTRLRQIVVNILGNAVKFTANGHISLSLDASPASPSPAGEPRYAFRISVKDTGIGIAPQNVEKLFQPFAQADASTTRQFGGTGLGLAICQRLASLMDGDIQVESVLEQGSTFTCTALLQVKSEQGYRRTNEFESKRALVIGPADRSQNQLIEFLKNFGVQTVAVDSLPETLEALEKEDAFHYAFIDFAPEFAEATQIAQAIKTKHDRYDLPLIKIAPFGQATQSSDPGAFTGQLVKPIAPFDLENRLREALDRAPKSQGTPPKVQPSPTTYPEKVLIVEDNAVNQLVATRLLKKFGYDAEVANSGFEAIDLCAEKNYDIIFMDIQMPGMNGLEAHSRIKEQLPSDAPIPWVVALTAGAMEGDRDSCLEAGMNDYLTKPIRPDQLQKVLARIREYLAQRP